MPLARINTQNQDLQRVQDNAGREFAQIEASPFITGNLLTGVQLIAGQDNPVAHKLSAAATIWLIVGNNANAVVWSTSSDSRYLHLSCSANCTLSLWVA